MWKRFVLVFALLLLGGAGAATAKSPSATERPRLVVVISIDQFRADYLTRFSDLYLPPGDLRKPGGFRWLMERGAWYPDCRYQHYRTVTGVGHAVLSTGAQPAVMGIVGNDWWDRSTGKTVYCTDDPASTVVGAMAGSKEKPMSPVTLLTTTLGDELELATGGQARTVSISLKDRAAILLSGHRTDTAIWIDEDTGGWVTSSHYARDGRLPAWVSDLNAKRLPEQGRRGTWKPSVSAEALSRSHVLSTFKRDFEHPLTGKDYGPWATSPEGNRYVFQSAREAIRAEKLGQDEMPDLLTLNLASNDYVGHKWGPDSPETLDISVQTDRMLSGFMAFLAKTVPGGLGRVTIAISADHGVCSVPEVLTSNRMPGGRVVSSLLRSAAEKALDETFGGDDWVSSTTNGEVYFNPATAAKHPDIAWEALERRVCEAARQIPHVYGAWSRSDVLAGRLPPTPLGKRLANNFHPTRSGDVFVVLDPLWIPSTLPTGTGATHGAPWTYDTHVPLLMAGFGVEPGVYGAAVAPAMMAPTLSHVLKVARPSGADEPLLPGLAGMK